MSLLGGVLGGVFDLFGQKKQDKQNERVMRNRVQWTVEDAKKAGISPLAALGSPVSGGMLGASRSNAGSHIASGVSSAVANRKNAELHELQKDKIRADIDESRARTAETLAATSRTRLANAAGQLRQSPGWPMAGHTLDKHGQESLKFPQGQTTLPVGPDIGEVVMGALARVHARDKAYAEARVRQKAMGNYGPRTRPSRSQAREWARKQKNNPFYGYHFEYR